MPKTQCRQRRDALSHPHSSSNALTSEVVRRLAVRRTLMPSHPLAKNASVGLPAFFFKVVDDIKTSARFKSAFKFHPTYATCDLKITDAEPDRFNKSGRIPRSKNISYSSYGTPGNRINDLVAKLGTRARRRSTTLFQQMLAPFGTIA